MHYTLLFFTQQKIKQMPVFKGHIREISNKEDVFQCSVEVTLWEIIRWCPINGACIYSMWWKYWDLTSLCGKLDNASQSLDTTLLHFDNLFSLFFVYFHFWIQSISQHYYILILYSQDFISAFPFVFCVL